MIGTIFSRACCDRTTDSGFEVKGGRFRLDIRKKFFSVWVLKHWNRFAQRGSGDPIPGNLQGQAGQGSEQPDLVKDVHAHFRVVGLES